MNRNIRRMLVVLAVVAASAGLDVAIQGLSEGKAPGAGAVAASALGAVALYVRSELRSVSKELERHEEGEHEE